MADEKADSLHAIRMDEFRRLRGRRFEEASFIDDEHFEMLWRCIRDGDLLGGNEIWGFTYFADGVHVFQATTKDGIASITYKIDDLKACKTRQDLIDLTNLTIIQAKIAGDDQ